MMDTTDHWRKRLKVYIVNLGGAGSEPEALRQMLELFDNRVIMFNIGRPRHFQEVLRGDEGTDLDVMIISGHGDEGAFMVPVLGESVYEPDEPRGELFGADEVRKCLRLENKIIMSTACTTGRKDMAEVFSEKNEYIAYEDYPEGAGVFMDLTRWFYEHRESGETE